MKTLDLASIAGELNAKARHHLIGELQSIRKELKGLRKRPGHDIFRLHGPSKTVFLDWACHYGGRSELQFNLGIEGPMFRHGVAFSFETSRTLPRIDVLIPKARRFNDYVRMYPEEFAHLSMWRFEDDKRRIGDYPPSPIPDRQARVGMFVFLGRLVASQDVDCGLILSDFDGLLLLYRYVESAEDAQPIATHTVEPFSFVPGCTTKREATTAKLSRETLDVTLRHNALEQALYNRLVCQYGSQNVGTEQGSGVGTRIDLVVRRPSEYWFYEIKTAESPRACIREAIGQLLEYSHWPGAQRAARIIVAGPSRLDDHARTYLRQLKQRFALPLDYEQIEPAEKAG